MIAAITFSGIDGQTTGRCQGNHYYCLGHDGRFGVEVNLLAARKAPQPHVAPKEPNPMVVRRRFLGMAMATVASAVPTQLMAQNPATLRVASTAFDSYA